MHIAVIVPPAHGHMNPLGTLGKELERRGHRITYVVQQTTTNRPGKNFDRVRFIGTDEEDDELERLASIMASQYGSRSMSSVIKCYYIMIDAYARDLPNVLRTKTNKKNADDNNANDDDRNDDQDDDDAIDAILTDESLQLPVLTVAEYLDLPVAVASAAAILLRDPYVPYSGTTFQPSYTLWGLAINRFYYAVLHVLTGRAVKIVNGHRKSLGLDPLRQNKSHWRMLDQGGKTRIRISQIPDFFDFPRSDIPDYFFYTQPWASPHGGCRTDVQFDWTRLDGRPVVYVTLGTVQNQLYDIFRVISEACARLPDVQMVMALGKRGATLPPDKVGPLPRGSIICDYAPQLEFMKRASLVISVGGLNTIFESMAEGVPMVLIPKGSDQPGNSARAERLGIAKLIRHDGRSPLSPDDVRLVIRSVLDDPSYQQAATDVRKRLESCPTLSMTADLIENALMMKQQNGSLTRNSDVAAKIYDGWKVHKITPNNNTTTTSLANPSMIMAGALVCAAAVAVAVILLSQTS